MGLDGVTILGIAQRQTIELLDKGLVPAYTSPVNFPKRD